MTIDPASLIGPFLAAAVAGLMAWGAIKNRVDHLSMQLRDIDNRLDGMPEVYVSKELHRETLKQIKESMSEMKDNIKSLMAMALQDRGSGS